MEQEKDQSSEWEMYRTKLKKECEIAISHCKETHHGTGFIVGDHRVLTAKHVIQDHLNDRNRYIVCISYPTIKDQQLPCEVVNVEPSMDLTLLFCEELDCNIPQLPLSGESLKLRSRIHCAGYPPVGPEVYIVEGMVSGTFEQFGDNRPSLLVLQCPGFHGFSGGPVVKQINDQLTVVGMLVQKQIKNFLTMDGYCTLQEVREAVESGASDVTEREKNLYKLFCKIITGFEKEKQDGFLHALPGKFIVQFVNNQ